MSSRSQEVKLCIDTPEWAEPLLYSHTFKFARGGRASGKSHFFAELLIDEHIANPDQRSVCIREIQRSLTYSAFTLIKDKIGKFGVSHLFKITQGKIQRVGGSGFIIFQGMQDHTADSIKSLEGFDRAWCEEAQTISTRSIDLLVPTIIRKKGSQIWFSWNPENDHDAVEQELGRRKHSNKCVDVSCTYLDNPWCDEQVYEEAEACRSSDIDKYNHIWLGHHNNKSEAQIFAGKYRVDEFDPLPHWDGPYYGLDFGFANDPTAAVECWRVANTLFISKCAGAVRLELDSTGEYMRKNIIGIERYTIRADCSRPESISYIKRKKETGLPHMAAVSKWSGSVKDGIEHLLSYDEIVIHPRCEAVQDEARLYKYKTNRAGDVLPEIEDKNNHYFDAIRYALAPLIKRKSLPTIMSL